MYTQTIAELVAQQYQTDRRTEAARSCRRRGFLRHTRFEG